VDHATGALADRTRHRKTLLWSLLLLCNVSCLLLLTAGSGPNSWMGLSALLVLTLAANELVGVPVLAYLPEVTTDPVKSMALSSASTIVFVVTCIVFAGVAIAIGGYRQPRPDSIKTIRSPGHSAAPRFIH
jgi:MFS family permease